MSAMDKFLRERDQVRQALSDAGVMQVLFNKDEIPKSLPVGIVVLEEETGTLPTGRRFVDTEIAWSVYLVVNASKADDPDAELYRLKENFRKHYGAALQRDIPKVEYYTSRVDGARLVRIALMTLSKAGGNA